MAYSDFTAKDLIEKFGVKFLGADLFTNISPISPTEWLNTSLEIGQKTGFSTEKSRSERLVTPIHKENPRKSV